jgi:hypothetical protein
MRSIRKAVQTNARHARAFVVIVAVSLAASVAFARDIYEKVTVDATVGGVGFTAANIDPPGERQMTVASCRLRPATGEIAYTFDGTVPTATNGNFLEPGDPLILPGHDRLVRFRAIRTGATSGTLDCNYQP